MTIVTLADLVRELPGSEFRAKKNPNGVSYIETPNPRFVAPDLEVIKPIEPGRTSAVLLSAPGAVGKSTLAAELASQTRSLLWDLSEFQVGSRTFSGTVFEAFDFEATGVQKRFREGAFLFIFDALDEAQVRAGASNFDAFLSELAADLKEPREKPTLVLLARTDTAEWIHLFMDNEGVPLAHYQISYFDHVRAVSFLERRLDDRRAQDSKQATHRQQAKPFSEARSSLFALIYQLFNVSEKRAWEDSRVRDFLGYAPVLEALTDYLDVANYMALIQELKEDAGLAKDPWDFLVDIVNRLLVRECGKVQAAVRDQLEPAAREDRWDNWENLYREREQCARVLAHSIRMQSPPFDSGLPGSVARAYEDALKTIMPQHPFLSGRDFANVVFKEYCYAWGVTRGDKRLAEALREAMRDREKPFLPSPLFGHFVFSIDGSETPLLDGQDFGVFYESLLSRGQKPFLSILQRGETARATIAMTGEARSEVEVDILDAGPGIHFWRRLGNAEVDVQAPVQLGLPEQRFSLGPAVDLDCKRLSISCDDLEIDVGENVRIRAQSYAQSVRTLRLRIRNEASGTVAVNWPDIAHPWSAYRSSEFARPTPLGESIRGDTLRKFVLMFRRQRSRKRSTLMTARWSPEQQSHRDELIALALKRGVLREVPGYDTLELTSDFVSLGTLVTDSPALSPRTFEFVSEYLGRAELDRILPV